MLRTLGDSIMPRIILACVVTAFAACPAAAQEPYDFAGFYAGVLAGGTWGSVDGYYAGTVPVPVDYDFTLDPTGLTLGALAGYSFTSGDFVLRLEGDASAVIGADSTFIYPLDTNRQDRTVIHGTGHLRGLAGLQTGSFVPFVAAGLAVAGVTQYHTGPVGLGTETWSESRLFAGPSIGAGADIDLGNGIDLRLEVLADFFGEQHYDWTTSPVRYTDATLTLVTARAGLTIPLLPSHRATYARRPTLPTPTTLCAMSTRV